MPAINDYECSNCMRIVESMGTPTDACECGGQWRLIFRTAPQIRTQHASCVDHVCALNEKRMADAYDEDMSPGSPYQQAMQEVAHHIRDVE